MVSLRHLLSVSSVAIAALAFVAFAAPTRAKADTYNIVPIFSDNGYNFYGMDDVGNVVFTRPFDCGTPTCYYTLLNGVLSGTSSTVPVLSWDYSAVPCVPLCSVTNNGRTATVTYESDQLTQDLDLIAGASLPQILLQTRGFSGSLAMNGLGDIVFDLGNRSEWYEAVNLDTMPAPEPSGLLLLATGALGIAGLAMRRRLATFA